MQTAYILLGVFAALGQVVNTSPANVSEKVDHVPRTIYQGRCYPFVQRVKTLRGPPNGWCDLSQHRITSKKCSTVEFCTGDGRWCSWSDVRMYPDQDNKAVCS
ncbi:hypothetical protein F4778DRAFT_741863 [Xylariomycetidae sp. FL2044]|nr:hypothetical protein F4778DRAFT_741863 [Xylariomycetidae sp. FL2044]